MESFHVGLLAKAAGCRGQSGFLVFAVSDE